MEQQQYETYTDLAVEVKESFPGDGGEIPGVVLEEEVLRDTKMKVTRVVIETREGSQAMQKPIGTYLTLESPYFSDGDSVHAERCGKILAEYVRELLPSGCKNVLAVGLGNQGLTADALGPRTIQHLWITRHLAESDAGTALCGMVPGVMGQTGMESAEMIRGVIREVQPDALIVIDALAARSASRLGTTIQLSDTGIPPGSGVGNHRDGITQGSMGVPVIAVGVPTVVGTATIACDTLDALTQMLEQNKSTRQLGKNIREFAPAEKYRLVRELLEPRLSAMFVMPKDMDVLVGELSELLAEGINRAVLGAAG